MFKVVAVCGATKVTFVRWTLFARHKCCRECGARWAPGVTRKPMRFLVTTIVILGLLFVTAAPGWARKWTDSTGKFSTEAELVELQGDNVILEKTNGQRISIPIARLSEADRRFLRSLGTPASKVLAQPGRSAGSGQALGFGPPVSGKVHGQAFKPDKAELKNGVLTLRQGKGFFADVAVKIFLFLDEGESLDGRTIQIGKQRPFGSSPAQVHLIWKKPDRNLPETEMFMDNFVMKLEFGKTVNGKMPGRIDLQVGDAARTSVAGSFVVKDPSAPLTADDAPYVQGSVALKGRDEFDLKAGYVGYNSAGKRQSNMAGSTFSVPSTGPVLVRCATFKPRLTTLAMDGKRGCTYRHVKVEPGHYLVYVRWGERFLDWKWVVIADGTELTIDLTVDPAMAGALEVMLPATAAKEKVRLIPLDADGQLPQLGIPVDRLRISSSLGMEVTAQAGKAIFEGLRAGGYRVVAGSLQQDANVRPSETTQVILAQRG